MLGLADALQTTPHHIMKGGADEAATEAHLLGLYRICRVDDKKLLLETAKAFAARAAGAERLMKTITGPALPDAHVAKHLPPAPPDLSELEQRYRKSVVPAPAKKITKRRAA